MKHCSCLKIIVTFNNWHIFMVLIKALLFEIHDCYAAAEIIVLFYELLYVTSWIFVINNCLYYVHCIFSYHYFLQDRHYVEETLRNEYHFIANYKQELVFDSTLSLTNCRALENVDFFYKIEVQLFVYEAYTQMYINIYNNRGLRVWVW